jgi:expansin (peptidoglycan-binding protein)
LGHGSRQVARLRRVSKHPAARTGLRAAAKCAGRNIAALWLLPTLVLGCGSDSDSPETVPTGGTSPDPTATVAPGPGIPGTVQPGATGPAGGVVPPGATGSVSPPVGSPTSPTGPGPGGTTSPTTPTGTNPDTPVEPVIDEALIDDFEDGDAIIADRAGRKGQWTAYNDSSAGATQTPAGGRAVNPEAGGAGGSGYAAHTSGSGFSEWGAGMDFNNPGSGASSRLPFDASSYQGISFKATGSGTVRVELPIPSTTDSAGGGTCVDGCFDTHGKSITVQSEWTEHTISFTQLEQEGWGTATSFDASKLLGLAFKVPGSADAPAEFDFWIDDVRFVDEAGPGGTPGGDPSPGEPVSQDPSSEPGQCKDLGGYQGNGSITYYYFDQGSAEVNCSYQITGRNPDKVAHIATGDGGYFGAMNTADYNNAAMCGACVEVTRDGNRKVVLTIVDQCPIATNPKCTAGHIDLSVAAFDQVANRGGGEGYVGTGNGGTVGNISWKYVPCPTNGNISFKLKEPTNANWNQVLVQNHAFPIKSVEINGKPATRQAYNYWEPPDGKMGPEPYEIKVTDVQGGVITSYITRDGGDLDSSVQLSCQ